MPSPPRDIQKDSLSKILLKRQNTYFLGYVYSLKNSFKFKYWHFGGRKWTPFIDLKCTWDEQVTKNLGISEAVSGADSGVDVSLGVGGGLRKTGLPLISIVDVSIRTRDRLVALATVEKWHPHRPSVSELLVTISSFGRKVKKVREKFTVKIDKKIVLVIYVMI